jgi:hypothetical protein
MRLAALPVTAMPRGLTCISVVIIRCSLHPGYPQR